MNKEIYVYFDDAYTEAPALVGVLSAQQVRGREVFSFEFAGDWLHDSRCHLLDPDLQLFSGRQYLPESKTNFGLFLDSSPDRWGRVLLDRREGYRARAEQRPRRNLQESDYLLGVFDESRMGALRMKLTPNGDFLDNDPEYSTPPFTSLRELENAAWQLEQDGEGLSLNINEHDNALDFALALEVAPFAGISKANASQMIEQTKEAVARWRTWAALFHIPREEQEMMAKAFEH